MIGLSVGFDVGLKGFIELTNGEHIDNPRFFIHEESALAKAQRKLYKMEKATPESVRALKVDQRIYERITNKRRLHSRGQPGTFIEMEMISLVLLPNAQAIH